MNTSCASQEMLPVAGSLAESKILFIGNGWHQNLGHGCSLGAPDHFWHQSSLSQGIYFRQGHPLCAPRMVNIKLKDLRRANNYIAQGIYYLFCVLKPVRVRYSTLHAGSEYATIADACKTRSSPCQSSKIGKSWGQPHLEAAPVPSQ